MPELIEKEAALKLVSDPHNQYHRIVKEFLLTAPTIEAEPVRRGRWIDAHMISGGDFNRCSECGCYIEQVYFANDYNVRYCPNCGAKMDGGADNG